MLSHNDLESYYKVNFAIMHYHKWSLDEIEGVFPFEKDLYVMLLIKHLEEEELKHKKQNQGF